MFDFLFSPFYWVIGILIGKIAFEIYQNYNEPEGQPERAIRKESKQDNSPKKPVVIIIGAGAAGLAAGGALKAKGIPFVIIERNSDSGTIWRGRYDRLHLHTSRDCSGLPHFPIPTHFPIFVPKDRVADYLESYASLLGLENILYNHNVKRTEYNESSKIWTLTVENLKTNEVTTMQSKYVVVGTGENAVPKVPKFNGQEKYKGKIFHSSDYKNGSEFKGKKVLLVGFGNSGGELSIDLWENDALPTVLVRSPFNIIPRWFVRFMEDVLDKYLKAGSLPRNMSKDLPILVNKFLYSDLNKFGLVTPKRDSYIGLDQENSHNPPVIDIGQVELIRNGGVKIVTSEIDKFTEDGVIFKNGKKESFDAVVLATGYQKVASFAAFLPEKMMKIFVSEHGVVKSCEFAEQNIFFLGNNDVIGRFRHMRIEALQVADKLATLLK